MTSEPAGSGSSPPRLNNFDLLRLISATQVAICHGLPHLKISWARILDPFIDLFPGVPIFFLISGFLIAGSLERNSNRLSEYFKNRALRIFPALWLCLAVSVISVLTIRPDVFRQAEGRQIAVWLAAQASLVQFWNPGFLRSYGVGVLNGSLWTIPVEMQFYVVLPVLYRIFGWRRHRRNGALVALVVVCSLLNWHMRELDSTAVQAQLWFKLYRETFVPNLFMFLLGVWAKRNFHRIYPLVAGRAWLWFPLHASVTFGSYGLGITTWNPLTQSLLAMSVFALAYTRPGLSSLLLRGNDISYGTYLYNMVVINAMRELGYVKEPAFLFVALAIIWTLAAISWRWVEMPALAHKSRPSLQRGVKSAPARDELPLQGQAV
jgi:peptidoglycan/LPS O-acetylase OafA/YrhL